MRAGRPGGVGALRRAVADGGTRDPSGGWAGEQAPEDSGILVRPPDAEDSPEEASRVVREALRRAPFPSLSGLAFEVMGLAWILGGLLGIVCVSSLVTVERRVSEALGRFLPVPPPGELLLVLALAAPIVALCVRVAAGLGRIASEGRGQGSGANLVQAFALGGRTQIAALAIFLQVFGMMAAATMVLLAPLALLSITVDLGPFGVVLAGIALTFGLFYGAALGALQELAMASLVRHERGTGSAVLHAWRLMRHKRLTLGRMAMVEMLARVIIVVTAAVLARQVGTWAGVAQLLLFGALVGGLRCQAWSLAYPRVGGLAGPGRGSNDAARGPTETARG